jgi:hypothetical protein
MEGYVVARYKLLSLFLSAETKTTARSLVEIVSFPSIFKQDACRRLDRNANALPKALHRPII